MLNTPAARAVSKIFLEIMSVPGDLVPLPTQPWDERPDDLPLDVEECRTAIWRASGNITLAAQFLKCRPDRLRRFVNGKQRLINEVQEAKEQLVDAAEDVVRQALTSDDPARMDTMARFVLTNQGKERGWGNKPGGVSVTMSGGSMIIGWADGSTIQGSEPPKSDVEEAEVVS